MSNAALKCAADVCLELPNYQVIICPSLRSKRDDILGEITDYIPSKAINIHRILKSNSNCYIEFTNGNIIRIVTAHESCRGYKANLVEVDSEVSEEFINTVLRPMEIKQLREKR